MASSSRSVRRRAALARPLPKRAARATRSPGTSTPCSTRTPATKRPRRSSSHWQAPLLDSASGKGDVDHKVEAQLKVDLGKPYPSSETHGLVDKVDVLAEIPYMVRKLVNYVAGTKPYIYQTLNPATLTLTLPEQYAGAGKGESTSIKGTLFEEHTFISG
ncbi:hypothetical protein L1887_59444 [Cichorium endivia]|nr:hypothetical protein L1887_59444 [Cichorium endivia]